MRQCGNPNHLGTPLPTPMQSVGQQQLPTIAWKGNGQQAACATTMRVIFDVGFWNNLSNYLA